MCGIAGLVKTNRNQDAVSVSELEQMVDSMIHRGPDDKGLELFNRGRAGLGHRRLAIIDLSSAGHQPMANQERSLWIVFNGEIYNHLDIRKELEMKGYQYVSQSDTETIIYAYQEWGEECLEHFRGMFAFAIWDTVKKELFFARDRIGIKPFYWTNQDGVFYFASEIKAILTHPKIDRRVNEQAVYDYLTLFSVPAPQTMFDGIYKLPAGHCGKVRESGEVKVWQYWDLRIEKDYERTEGEWVKVIREELYDSIEKRMMSDVPFGAYLSGGVDSSVNTVVMQELRGQPLDTFSIGFKNDPEFNELNYARMVRDRYGTNYHEILIDQEDLFEWLENMAYYQDEPIGDWVCLPVYYVSKLIRDSGTIVAQVGEGADELFCGYSDYMRYLKTYPWYRAYSFLPHVLKRVGRWMAHRTPRVNGNSSLMSIFDKALQNEFLFWGGAFGFQEYEKKELFQRAYDSTYRWINRWLGQMPNREDADFLDQMTYIEFKHRLPELLLMRVDKMSMQHSIEARVPFLDHKFVEEMVKVPTEKKIKNGVSKYLFKEAVRGIIPDEIIDRKKQGFGTPFAKWFKDPIFKSKIKVYFGDNEEILGEYFDYRALESYFVKDEGLKVWLLLNFILWHKEFIR